VDKPFGTTSMSPISFIYDLSRAYQL